jgi:hypothetical protein
VLCEDDERSNTDSENKWLPERITLFRLFLEISVLDVCLERAAELMRTSPPRAATDSSTNDDELMIPREKARSASLKSA